MLIITQTIQVKFFSALGSFIHSNPKADTASTYICTKYKLQYSLFRRG